MKINSDLDVALRNGTLSLTRDDSGLIETFSLQIPNMNLYFDHVSPSRLHQHGAVYQASITIEGSSFVLRFEENRKLERQWRGSLCNAEIIEEKDESFAAGTEMFRFEGGPAQAE